MTHHLIVTQAFANYARGARIEDEVEIARIVTGEHAVHVVRVKAEEKTDQPETEPAPPALPHGDDAQ